MPLIVVLAPAAIGDEIELIADDHTVRGLAESRTLGLQHLHPFQVARQAHDASRVGPVLYRQESIAMHVQSVDAVERIAAMPRT